MMVLTVIVLGLYVSAGRSRLRLHLMLHPDASDLADDLAREFRRARLHAAVLVVLWPLLPSIPRL